MKNPELADKIFDVLQVRNWKRPIDVAMDLNEDPATVEKTIMEMIALKKEWFTTQKPRAGNVFRIIKNSAYENGIHLWKLTGGFVNLQREIELMTYYKEKIWK